MLGILWLAKDIVSGALSVLSLLVGASQGPCIRKIELAPTYQHLDVIEAKKTVKEIDMPAIRGEFTLATGNGYYIRPTGLYGKKDDSEFYTYGGAIGKFMPFGCFVVALESGVNYAKLSTNVPIFFESIGEVVFREHYEALVPFTGVEVVWCLGSNLRVSGRALYAWSHSKTKNKDHSSDNSSGPTYSLTAEYDIYPCWSVNLGATYNESLSRDKNGIRSRGIKLGLAHCF